MNIGMAVSWVSAHWLLILVAAYLVGDLVVAVTPKRYQRAPWFGAALAMMHWASFHLHADDPEGTIKVPFLGIPIRFGANHIEIPAKTSGNSMDASARETQPDPIKPPKANN